MVVAYLLSLTLLTGAYSLFYSSARAETADVTGLGAGGRLPEAASNLGDLDHHSHRACRSSSLAEASVQFRSARFGKSVVSSASILVQIAQGTAIENRTDAGRTGADGGGCSQASRVAGGRGDLDDRQLRPRRSGKKLKSIEKAKKSLEPELHSTPRPRQATPRQRNGSPLCAGRAGGGTDRNGRGNWRRRWGATMVQAFIEAMVLALISIAICYGSSCAASRTSW